MPFIAIHGDSRTRLYNTYYAIKNRCHNPKHVRYADYGGRNILLCNEWLNDYLAFKKWSIENGYSESLSIERIDVNQGYSPDNCKWIPMKEQAMNKRTSLMITARGETRCLAEWSRIVGIHSATLHSRYRVGDREERLFR
jgi:hypothetical protein